MMDLRLIEKVSLIAPIAKRINHIQGKWTTNMAVTMVKYPGAFQVEQVSQGKPDSDQVGGTPRLED